MAAGFTSDALRQLGQELKEVDKKFASQIRKAVRTAVTEAGADIVAEARQEASFSRRIPGAIYVRPNFSVRSAGIRIVVNRREAPHARVLEFGNYDAPPTRPFFYHPVFGHKKGIRVGNVAGIAKQNKHEFFFKAIKKKDAATEKRFLDAIDAACREVGFR